MSTDVIREKVYQNSWWILIFLLNYRELIRQEPIPVAVRFKA